MFRAAFESFALLELPVLAMGIFMVVFGLVLVRSLLGGPDQGARDAALAQLPLADDPVQDAPTGGRHG